MQKSRRQRELLEVFVLPTSQTKQSSEGAAQRSGMFCSSGHT